MFLKYIVMVQEQPVVIDLIIVAKNLIYKQFTILIIEVLQFGILCHYLSLVQQAFPLRKR